MQEITNIAVGITQPGRALAKFVESKDLRRRRHEALHMSPGQARKTVWKMVQKQHREEHRLWRVQQLDLAGQKWWKAKKAVDRSDHDSSWKLRLRADERWRETLKAHFGGIFNKSNAHTVETKLRLIDDRLRRRCKQKPWEPFTAKELHEVRKRWSGGKACGPDSVSHEALRVLEHDDNWRGRFCTCSTTCSTWPQPPPTLCGESPSSSRRRGTLHEEWSDTRPITLSSASLKTFSQLLISRVSHLVQQPSRLQWARRSRQGVELILILRRVCRVARDWGIPMYIAKLDIRKAFGLRLDIPGGPRRTDRDRCRGGGGQTVGGSSVDKPHSRQRDQHLLHEGRNSEYRKQTGFGRDSPIAPWHSAECLPLSLNVQFNKPQNISRCRGNLPPSLLEPLWTTAIYGPRRKSTCKPCLRDWG